MAGDHQRQDLEALYELVRQQCTLAAIQNVLREYKPLDRENVKVTEESKEAVIQSNLRAAVDRGIIPITRVYDLLRDAEENGSQHVFYYLPRNKQAAKLYASGATIGERLLGGRWASRSPRFAVLPEEPFWSDFRVREGEWVAKVYGQDTRLEQIGEEEQDGELEGGSIVVRRFRKSVERTVSLMRWNPLGILEVRVPTSTARRTIEAMHNRIWKMAEGAISLQDFEPWDLSGARTTMLRDHAKWRKLYRLGDTQLQDSGYGTALFSPYSPEDELFAAAERGQAIEVLLKQHNRCQQLVVTWLTQKATDALPHDLRVVIGSKESHEIVIGAKTTPKAVDYVTYRLREFAS